MGGLSTDVPQGVVRLTASTRPRRNGALAEKHPGRLIVNGRWDPREGEAGLRRLEEDAKRWNLRGAKLYTAEWYQGSRGWTLADEACKPFYEKCKELGIRNIHVHKGPTIWPLDMDAFDPKDVDVAATDNPELNFIVDHVGLPRVEDFCLHRHPGAQRVRRAGRSSSAGCSTRGRGCSPRSWGSCCYWIGEDRILFGSDYAIWQPQVADRGVPRLGLPPSLPPRSSPDYPRRGTDAGKRKILGLNAAGLCTASRFPPSCAASGEVAAG